MLRLDLRAKCYKLMKSPVIFGPKSLTNMTLYRN